MGDRKLVLRYNYESQIGKMFGMSLVVQARFNQGL